MHTCNTHPVHTETRPLPPPPAFCASQATIQINALHIHANTIYSTADCTNMIYNIHYIHTVCRTFPHLPAKFSPHVHPGNPFGLVFPARGISANRNESSPLLTAVLSEQHSGETRISQKGSLISKVHLEKKYNNKNWCLYLPQLQSTVLTISPLSQKRGETPLLKSFKRDLALGARSLIKYKML